MYERGAEQRAEVGMPFLDLSLPAMSARRTAVNTPGTGRSAFLVAAGILLSRLAGLIRDRVFAHYFGNSAAADAFRAAFRIPNLLQNLFGEGVLSASFIPVYARLLAYEDDAEAGGVAEAGRVAGAVITLLAFVVSLLVLIGVLTTPYLIDAIVPGFAGEKRDLTIRLVKILFPGAGLLVFSAWCLGILNSHGRFFISYAAPVLWNAAMIVTLIGFGNRVNQFPLAETLAWGSVAGSALQVGIQVPAVLRLVDNLRLSLNVTGPSVRTIVHNFVPVFISRGVVQISAYVDALLASFLPTGAVAALSYAQTLYILPVSLFGMSVSAAELPAMSSARGSKQEIATYLQQRLDAGLRRVAFFIVPSAVAFLALGDVIAGAVYQSGRFTYDDVIYVWGILAGSAVGLLASTLSRLYASTFYALHDTRTPLYCAVVRIVAGMGLGYLCAIPLPPMLDIDARWGVAGLTVASSFAGWIEFTLLWCTLNRRIGRTGLALPFAAKLWTAAVAAAAVVWGVKFALAPQHPILAAGAILVPYGLIYFAITYGWGTPEAQAIVGRVARVAAAREDG
jgi:putative peptidoglycan lipid II flippase